MVLKMKLANFPFYSTNFNISASGPLISVLEHYQTSTILYEPENKHLIFQHMIYEPLRHNDLKTRENKGFIEKILHLLSVFSAYSMHFHILKSGPNQKYNSLYMILTYKPQTGFV
jgi:hypothetical protein